MIENKGASPAVERCWIMTYRRAEKPALAPLLALEMHQNDARNLPTEHVDKFVEMYGGPAPSPHAAALMTD
jgi:hypothetical protein